MSIFTGQSRSDLRQMYLDAWRKNSERLPLEAVEAQIVQVIEEHPEYHVLLGDRDAALTDDFNPASGQTNPFLHMGLHLTLRDQIAIDRPSGIRNAYKTLACRRDPHNAEHAIIDHLAAMLWQSQRDGTPPNDQLYLLRVKRLLR